MYPPNYDLRGVQIVHDRHLKELREEAAAYHFAQEVKRGEAEGTEMQPRLVTRVVQHLIERVRALIDAQVAKPSAARGCRTGFDNG
jgi:hypothetical protein